MILVEARTTLVYPLAPFASAFGDHRTKPGRRANGYPQLRVKIREESKNRRSERKNICRTMAYIFAAAG
jgi:hypothetical protein